MILLRLLTFLAVLLFLTGLVSQVVIPIFRGTVLFPTFRSKREAELVKAMEAQRQKEMEDEQEQELNSRKQSSTT